MTQVSLSRRFVQGASWLTAVQIISKLTSVIRMYVIVQLVPQGDIGLYTAAMMVGQLIEVLGQTGMTQALIQRPGDSQPYAGTVFLAQAGRGFILGAILFLLGPGFEQFFEKPGLAQILIPIAFCSILGGFRNVGVVLLEREINFGKPATIDLIRAITDLVVSIVLASFWPNVWALVISQLSTFVIGTLLSYTLIPYRAPLHFDWVKFRELYRFGFWVFLEAMLSFSMVAGGHFVVTKILAKEDLATYQLAYMLGCSPTAEMCRVITRASFSLFSQMQTSRERATDAYLQVYAVTCFWIMLVVGGSFVLAPGIAYLLPPTYGTVAFILPWLALWGSSRALADVDGSMLQALGQPALASMILMVTFVAMFGTTIPLCLQFGVKGVAVGLGGVAIAAQALRVAVLTRTTGIPVRSLMVGLVVPLLAALLAAWPLYSALRVWTSVATIPQSVVVGIGYVALYIVAWLLLDRVFGTMYVVRLRRLFGLAG